MPELPEVETVVRGLREELGGRSIASVEIRRAASAAGQGAHFVDALTGAAVCGVRRRGKCILMDVCTMAGEHLVMACHLRMTGRLYLPGRESEPGKHVHVLFTLDNGAPMFFEDARTFGGCQVFLPEGAGAGGIGPFVPIDLWPFFASLGPEPLETSAEDLADLVKGRRSQTKALLLDQHVLAGVGNIYADESLHRAGIRPMTPVHRVSRKRLVVLFRHLQDVLQEAIDECGSSISDYRDARGDAGAFQNKFRAYGRAGKPCLCCDTPMQHARVAGRTSTYCPCCQK